VLISRDDANRAKSWSIEVLYDAVMKHQADKKHRARIAKLRSLQNGTACFSHVCLEVKRMKSLLSVVALGLLLGAAITVAIQHASAGGPDNPVTTKRLAWENRVIFLQHKNLKDRDDKQLESRLNEAGADGWECVGIAFDSNSGNIYAVTKRQK
jgi:hypothetical protein